MKTPEDVRKYVSEKRARFNEEMRLTQARLEQERMPYVAWLGKELGGIIDKAVDDGSVGEDGGIIDIEMLITDCNKKTSFAKLAGCENENLVRDAIAYLAENRWIGKYVHEKTVCYGPEPSTTVRGDFIELKPVKTANPLNGSF